MRTFYLTPVPSIAIALLLLIGATPLVSAQDPNAASTPPRIFVEDTIDQSRAIALIKRLGTARPIPLGVRLTISQSAIAPAATDLYLAAAVVAKVPVWIAVPAPATRDAMAPWRELLRATFTRHGSGIIILEVIFRDTPDDLQRFAIEVAATEARARGEVLIAASGADAAAALRMTKQLTANQAPYLDLFVVDDAMAQVGGESLAAARRAIPGLRIVKRSQVATTGRIVRDTLSTIATDTVATAWNASVETLTAAVAALAPARNLLIHPAEEIDPASVGLALSTEWR